MDGLFTGSGEAGRITAGIGKAGRREKATPALRQEEKGHRAQAAQDEGVESVTLRDSIGTMFVP